MPKRLGGRKITFEVDQNGCFKVTSHSQKGNRYPVISYNGTYWKVHRYIFTECFGEIPKGKVIRHKCDNTLCINPEHLEIGTQKDNVSDCVKRGRYRSGFSGELNPKAKLNPKIVKEIKKTLEKNEKLSAREIGLMFNISGSVIQHIKMGRIWKDV